MEKVILCILAIALIYFVVKNAIIYNFRRKNENLSNQELQHVIQDLYDDLDDYDWSWRKALEYQTGCKMLEERGV